MRSGTIAVAMLPPWVAYLLALAGWPDRSWVDADALRLGMNVEYVAAVVFPILGGLALDRRPPRWARLALLAAGAAAVTAFIFQGLGWIGVRWFWLGGMFTYAGWLWSPPDERRARTLPARTLLTVGTLVPVLFLVIVLSALTGADRTLLMGFLYFLAIYALELAGIQSRFHGWFARELRQS